MKNVTEDDVLALLKCIYGLVQAARQYHKKFVEILRSIGFKGGDVDPCLFTRKDSRGLVYVGLYVDDNLVVGHKDAVEDTICQL